MGCGSLPAGATGLLRWETLPLKPRCLSWPRNSGPYVIGDGPQPFLESFVRWGTEIRIFPMEQYQGYCGQLQRKRTTQQIVADSELAKGRELPELGRD